jgi:hypothetical protein
MPAAEIAFEQLGVAIEGTRLTAETNPTHVLNLEGLITPRMTRRRGSETRGGLSEFYRSKTVYRYGEWDGSGPLDTKMAPVLFNMAVKAVASGVAAVQGAVTADNAKLWTFNPTLTADDIETGTLFGGDPTLQSFRAAGGVIDELAISSDADSDEAVMVEVSGMTQFPEKVADPTYPGQVQGTELVPQDMQLWIDTSSAIGTTAITSLVSADVSLTNNISKKRRANGPASALTYNALGRGRRHLELEITTDFDATTLYDFWVAETILKTRIRFNGPLIELKSGQSFYHYVQADIYGPIDSFDWTEVADTNRGATFTIISEYNITAALEWLLYVQNASATL